MKKFDLKSIGRLSVLLAACCVQMALAESAVWQVSNKSSSLYLAGTFHLLNESDHPLPEAFDKAFQASSKVLFETDIEASSTPEFQMKAAQSMMFTDGRTLKSSLKPETYQALASFLAERGQAVENFAPFTPAGATLLLAVTEYQRLGMSLQHGVEYVYNQKARQANKSLDYLETPDEQLAFIANMGKGEEDDMVMYTLKDLANVADLVADMKQAWRKGDLKKMDKDSLKDMREQFPRTYAELIVGRNNNWLPKIEQLLTNAETEVVMVGALHLAGPDGLIAQLRKKGYKVSRL